ncbi:Mu transposase C-terminal domain-containing protein [Pseudarthrobacter sp. BRE9]|uniref:Mu transposase C-terminal domain-containing protein n=1 Tax=Pseudarthrobacter sp. BRE9 TaxID=2962582 RepID=UPI002881E4F3|nr:Mu transposase C-terminal domain-containing protein [Pseudarthrobacter sp. BRE9]MDT0168872.1 Mu transposase C-terminal domain-containing protein [Pseudarthrobacter sp. BRE9]
MNIFRIGDVVTYLKRQWEITEIAGSVLGLYDAGADERLSASIGRVAQENPPSDRLSQGITKLNTAASELSRSGSEILKDIDLSLADIEEVALGKPAGAEGYREGYGLGSSIWSRAGLKAAELEALGEQLKSRDPHLAKKVAVSRSTLLRRAKAYLQDGPAGLIDGRKTCNHRVTDGIAPEVLEVCGRVNKELVRRPRVSKKQRVDMVRARIEKMEERNFSIPGDLRLKQILDELARGMYLDGDAANRRSAANAPNWMYRSHPALMPGSRMQVDSTRLDIMLIFPDGSVQRPDLSMMSDQATRTVSAFALAKDICGADLAFMIAQAMTPRPRYDLPEELKNRWETERRDLPWVQMFDAEERDRFDGMLPLIRPRFIMTDNGRDYRSNVVDATCRQLGITLVRAAPYSPTDKGIAERLFGTLKTMFLAHLPGFTGGSISSGGDKKPNRKELLTLGEFAWLLERWLVHYWQNTPTDGLRDPRLGGGALLSPNAEYQAMFPYVGFIPKPLSRKDYIGLLPVVTRTIQKDGIQIEYRMYDAPGLGHLRQRTSGTELNGKWEVHYMPADPRVVWVYDPAVQDYIACEWKEDRFDKPFSKEVRDLALQILDDGGVDPALNEASTTRNFLEVALQELRRQRKKQAARDLERRIQDAQRGNLPNIANLRGQEGYQSPVNEHLQQEDDEYDDDGDDLEGFEGVNGWGA